jgi:hypothetical protein
MAALTDLGETPVIISLTRHQRVDFQDLAHFSVIRTDPLIDCPLCMSAHHASC